MTLNHTPAIDVAPARRVVSLFGALAAGGIRCCHWKSNSHLDAAISGETDLDLLVDRAQLDEFRRIVADHGFKAMRAAPGKDYPGVENHLGLDLGTSRVLHLHVHADLVLGQQFVKDYHLPIESAVLDSVREVSGIPIPAADMELIVLAMRAVLKYRARDALKDLLGVRGPGIPRAILAEATWLSQQTSGPRIERRLSELQGVVPAAVVREIIDVLTRGRTRGIRLIVLRARLRRALRRFRRLSRPRATLRYVAALWRKRRQSRRGDPKRRMRPTTGGTTIAVIGPDGAGKTSVIAATQRVLSTRMDVQTIYMGSSQPSAPTRALKRGSKLAFSATRVLERHRLTARLLGSPTRRTARLLLAMRRVVEGRQRGRRALEGQRAAETGSVVIFDRYPLEAVRIHDRVMDGARLDTELSQPRGRLIEHLVRRERELHDRISPPDHVIALRVDPDVSLGRKPAHDPESIHAKSESITDATRTRSDFLEIDANAPFEAVVREVNERIWDWL